MRKKGAISLSDAPYVVFVVGFIFLLMATLAYISSEYREGIGAPLTATVVNETGFAINDTTYTVSNVVQYNFEGFAVSSVVNTTGGNVIGSGNYTVDSTAGTIVGSATRDVNVSSVVISYTYNYCGTSCNVTQDLETELSNNTSIAGIVLTISLVAIVLTILIGVFMGMRKEM